MTDYKQLYASKLTTAEKVAEQVESGWVLGMDAGPSNTDAIMSALAQRAQKDALHDVKVHTMLDVYPLAFYEDNSLAGKVTGYSWFSSVGARNAINGGWADFIPAYYRDIPKYIRSDYVYDAFCIAVSPMDKHGYFSFANVNSYAIAMMEKAKRIFIEVNDCQPRAVCGAQIHVSQVDAIVEGGQTMNPSIDDILIHLKHLMIKVSNIILETFNKNAVSYIVNYKDSQVIKHLHIHICPNFNFEENTTLSEQEIYDILKDKFKNL